MFDDAQLPQAPGSDALAIRPLHDRTGLTLAGEADCTTRDRLHAALAALPADGAGEIHLDLADLEFIDLCCTREIVAITERHPAARLVVYRPPASLRRIIALLYPAVRIEFAETPGPAAREAEGITARPLARQRTWRASAVSGSGSVWFPVADYGK